MSTYRVNLKDMQFVLFDVLKADTQFAALGLADANRELISAVLEESARFCETQLAPLNAVGDREGCTFVAETNDVRTPAGFKQAYDQYVDMGWPSLVSPPEYGGQGLPETVGIAVKEMINASNLAWGNFPLLSHGATNAIEHHGSDWQKQVVLPHLINGSWTGTMCLTEPQCGTDLGLIKTRAVPNADGTYAITGTKIFITAGEHDLAENIIHLVLAKLPDAPEGSKGISLFLVPKFNIDAEGQLVDRNHVKCGSIEHKMGIHGSATCVMNFDDAKGYLVGQANKGLMAMFTMMNSARLGVGLQGLGLSDRATQNALRYARERLQMRAANQPARPDKPADPIIVHPDVRRMLLTNKALVEGGRMLLYSAGLHADSSSYSKDAAAAATDNAVVGYLTPIAKACMTEWSIECTYNAMQCLGGHGYIAEHGLEQLARDARITTLYEGTTGIQALDLLGRKVLQLKGEGMQAFGAQLLQLVTDCMAVPQLASHAQELGKAAQELQELTLRIAQAVQKDGNEVGAAAYDYLMYSGYVVLGYWWLRAAKTVLDGGITADAEFSAAKLETADFYFARLFPRTRTHAAAIRSGAAPLMTMPESHFDA
ncbi:acyl-CoA dehydrogenase C-terminal domain-containing protein [Aquilutibacter rugosus]|uniref:acyl-CoA dehydrogenase C-terminal domain-containing protein n=1 Tax=Aquilutibacter rugosus TaxID=3115820 RepID=UPI002F4133E3